MRRPAHQRLFESDASRRLPQKIVAHHEQTKRRDGGRRVSSTANREPRPEPRSSPLRSSRSARKRWEGGTCSRRRVVRAVPWSSVVSRSRITFLWCMLHAVCLVKIRSSCNTLAMKHWCLGTRCSPLARRFRPSHSPTQRSRRRHRSFTCPRCQCAGLPTPFMIVLLPLRPLGGPPCPPRRWRSSLRVSLWRLFARARRWIFSVEVLPVDVLSTFVDVSGRLYRQRRASVLVRERSRWYRLRPWRWLCFADPRVTLE